VSLLIGVTLIWVFGKKPAVVVGGAPRPAKPAARPTTAAP
jgi:hypothetical protein